MRCRELMSTNLEFLWEKATIQRAATLMADQGVGFLPICDAEGRPVGVVTDRDITTRAVAKNLATDRTPVEQIMSAPVITCLADAKVGVAEDLMCQERKARLVVTEEDGRVVGILSLADLLEHAATRPALHTARVVLWREALGPRGGASPETPLLKDDPIAQSSAATDAKEAGPHETAMTGGHWAGSMKEFPGT